MDAEEAGVRKRKRDGDGGGVGEGAAGAGEDVLVEEDGEEYAGIAEEAVAEVMRWLELEISLAAPPPPQPPGAAAAAVGFVTINGNEESCGPSFSDSASTVMASVDVRPAVGAAPPAVPWPWPAAAGEEAGAAAEEEVVDEEWVAQVLSGGAALEGM